MRACLHACRWCRHGLTWKHSLHVQDVRARGSTSQVQIDRATRTGVAERVDREQAGAREWIPLRARDACERESVLFACDELRRGIGSLGRMWQHHVMPARWLWILPAGRRASEQGAAVAGEYISPGRRATGPSLSPPPQSTLRFSPFLVASSLRYDDGNCEAYLRPHYCASSMSHCTS